MFKAVVFDCFGVLTTDLWRQFLDSLPNSVNKNELSQLNRLLDAGFISDEDFMNQVTKIAGKKPPKVENLKEGQIVKNDTLLKYVKSLKSKNYKTAILSNISTNWIIDMLLSQEEQSYFDEYIFSYKVGLLKPNPDIFNLTCDKLGVDLSQAIFIDDNSGFCDAAEQIGLKSVHFEDNEQVINRVNKLIGG